MHNNEQPAVEILLVEDNDINQEVALAMLQLMGLSADIAGDGKQALTMLGQKTYDLILMDCKMPVMNGFEATQIIRKRESKDAGHIPIIAVTANSMTGDHQQCLDAGMDDYIAKPFTQKDLAAVIYKWLPQVKQVQPAQDP